MPARQLTIDKAQTGNRAPVLPRKQNNVATQKIKAGQRESKLVCVNHLNRPRLGDPPSWSYTHVDKDKIYQWEKSMRIINVLQQSSLPSKSSARELPSSQGNSLRQKGWIADIYGCIENS